MQASTTKRANCTAENRFATFFNGTNMCHLRSIAEKPNELRLIDAARPGKVF